MFKLPNLEDEQRRIIVPLHISREFIQTHRQWNFIYSADYLLRGALGQMWAAHNEPNTFPVPTLYKYCSNPVFFQDHLEQEEMINEFLNKIPKDKPLIVFPKIGLGHSRMKEFSPRLFTGLHRSLKEIEYPYKEIKYHD